MVLPIIKSCCNHKMTKIPFSIPLPLSLSCSRSVLFQQSTLTFRTASSTKEYKMVGWVSFRVRFSFFSLSACMQDDSPKCTPGECRRRAECKPRWKMNKQHISRSFRWLLIVADVVHQSIVSVWYKFNFIFIILRSSGMALILLLLFAVVVVVVSHSHWMMKFVIIRSVNA